MIFLIKCDDSTMVEVSGSDLNQLRTLYPELVCRVINERGHDVTAEYLATKRTELIYG